MIGIVALVALVGAAVMTLFFVGDLLGAIAKARSTPRRGRWGLIAYRPLRTRRLGAAARRWETALLRARNGTRWNDLIATIERLEHDAGLPNDPSPPPRFDVRWIRSRLSGLEGAVERTHQT